MIGNGCITTFAFPVEFYTLLYFCTICRLGLISLAPIIRCGIANIVAATWWRHPMETLSASLVICAGNSPVTGEFPSQMPVTRNFDVFFDIRLNKRLVICDAISPLWRHCNANISMGIAQKSYMNDIYRNHYAIPWKKIGKALIIVDCFAAKQKAFANIWLLHTLPSWSW